ncbi:MAG: MFS transporter [Actinomycetales bacterium]|nr:MFS transporter [Actinomycetales bacterium]
MTTWTLDRGIRFLPWAVLVATFDRAVVIPMLLGMSRDFGVSISTMTLSVSAYYLAYGLAQPAWGLVSDRLGRIPTLRLALVLAAVTDLISVVPMPIGPFIVSRAVAGAMMAGVFPTAVIFIGDAITDRSRRQPAIVGLQAGVALGLTMGTILGGIGIATIGWQAFFVITAVVSVAMAWYVRGLPDPSSPGPRLPALTSFRLVLSQRWPWTLYTLVFVEAALLLGAFALVPTALEATGSSAYVAGLMAGGYGAAVLAGSLVVGRLSLRVPPHLLLLIGGVAAAVAFAILGVEVTPVLVFVSVALQGVAWVFMHTTLQTWATMLSDTARATAVSLFAGFMFLGNGFGSYAAGVALESRGASQLFWATSIGLAAFTAVAVVSRRTYSEHLG